MTSRVSREAEAKGITRAPSREIPPLVRHMASEWLTEALDSYEYGLDRATWKTIGWDHGAFRLTIEPRDVA